MGRDKKLIIGNWKMNLTIHESSMLAHRLEKLVRARHDVEVVLAPSFLALQSIALQINHRQFKLAAQNLYWRDSGAYTGEVSASQLHGLVQYAIIGHSERRHIFSENEKEIRLKVQAAIRNHIRPVLCVGETAIEKADGETREVVNEQLTSGLANITSEEVDRVVIAYEPVWAIGTGSFAPTKDVEAVIKMIRGQLSHLFGEESSNRAVILYGGSVSPENATDYLATPGVDGLLIGGMSFNVHAFSDVIKAAHRSSSKELSQRGDS